MITVEVKVPVIAQVTKKTEEALQSALGAIGEYARSLILQEAQLRLHSTYLDYAHGMQDSRSVITQPGSVTVTLVGKLPNALEQGFKRFDMKPGLLDGRRAKTAKHGGKYIDIPFRHGTPGSTTLKPMSPSAAKNMAQAIRMAKRNATVRLSQRTVGKGTHKVGIYDQLTRVPKQYEKRSGSKYMTFRRVSFTSAGKSWIHPGLPGIRAFEAAHAKLSKDIPRIVHDYVTRAL